MRERIEHTDHQPDREPEPPAGNEFWGGRDNVSDTRTTEPEVGERRSEGA